MESPNGSHALWFSHLFRKHVRAIMVLQVLWVQREMKESVECVEMLELLGLQDHLERQ